MTGFDIDSFLQKSKELKALFVLGEKVIPFLEEILIFTKDIFPTIEGINKSIEENIKKMPNASKQLSKVSKATEIATNQIMDMVDSILDVSDGIQSNLKKIKETESLQTKDRNIIIDNSTDMVDDIKDKSNSIMIALQVQDITSQQIAAINHLLDTIHNKLIDIIKKFNSSDLNHLSENAEQNNVKTNIKILNKPNAFDPNAIDSMTDNETRQDNIDAMFNNSQNSSVDNSRKDETLDNVSPADIDALFNG